MVVKRKHEDKQHLRVMIRILQSMVVLSCIIFISYGWYQSLRKFREGQTSLSTFVNETDAFTFPSMTFCLRFRDSRTLSQVIRTRLKEQNKAEADMTKEDMEHIIDEIGYKRTDFLTLFSHPEHGDPWKGRHILRNDSLWTESIPHPRDSGICHTYDPPFASTASKWRGLRLGIKLPGTWNSTQVQKETMLNRLVIFFHEKGAFTFYAFDDRPNSSSFSTSWLAYGMETEVILSYSRLTRLSKKDDPCQKDPGYSLNECIEREYSKKRGCQQPWNYFDQFNNPACKNMTSLISSKGREWDWVRHRLNNRAIYKTSGCQMPCKSGKYHFEVKHYRLNNYKRMDNGAEWVMYIWFKNFRFHFEEEYIV